MLGDIILAINGKKIDSASDLYRILDKAEVGDQVKGVGVFVRECCSGLSLFMGWARQP